MVMDQAFEYWWAKRGERSVRRMDYSEKELAHFAFGAGYLSGRKDPGQLAYELLMARHDEVEAE